MKFGLFCIFFRARFHSSSSLLPIMDEAITFMVRRNPLHSLEMRGENLYMENTLYILRNMTPFDLFENHIGKKIPSFVSRKRFYFHGLFRLARSFSDFGKQILLGHVWYIAQDRMISTCHLKWGKYSWPSDMQTFSSSSCQHLFLLALNWCKKQCHPATSILEIDQL